VPWLADVQPTAFAGLPMLLTVLEALGVQRWIEAQDPDIADVFARAWLGHVAERLRVPEADGMCVPLALAGQEAAAFAAGTTSWKGFAWPAWSDAPLPQREQVSAHASLAPWRIAVRRALRLQAGIGIASLCRRPGLVATTATHIDVTLPLEAVDLRLRRSGLDDGGFRVQQFQQALGRPRRAHHVAPHFRHGADPARDQRRVQHERGQLPAGHAARMHLVRADPQHEDDAAHHRGDDQRRECGAHAGAARTRVRRIAVTKLSSALAAKRRVSRCSWV